MTVRDIDREAEEWAYFEVKKRLMEGTLPSDAGTLEIAKHSYLAGYASGSKSKWVKYPENKPPGVDVFLVMLHDDLADHSYPETAIWDKDHWDFVKNVTPPQFHVTHFMTIQLPDQVSKEGE